MLLNHPLAQKFDSYFWFLRKYEKVAKVNFSVNLQKL